MRTKQGAELFGRSIEPSPEGSDRPVGLRHSEVVYGSDVVAGSLRALDVEFVAMRPSPETAALHDSLINHTGNLKPRLLVSVNTGHAVNLALGHARACCRPMVVACADVDNALPRLKVCAEEQLAVVVLAPDVTSGCNGADSPFKTVIRIDDQHDVQERIAQAYWISRCEPCGPVCVALSARLMEARAPDLPLKRASNWHQPLFHSGVGSEKQQEIVDILQEANAPVILAGRVGQGGEDWSALTAFAEACGARVITDFKMRAAFDSRHPLYAGAIGGVGEEAARAAYAVADVVVALDWREWERLIAHAGRRRRSFLIEVSPGADRFGANGTYTRSGEYLPDVVILATPGDFLRDIAISPDLSPIMQKFSDADSLPSGPEEAVGVITSKNLIAALLQEIGGEPATLAHTPCRWRGPQWPVVGPLDALGTTHSGGLGASIGAALALTSEGRFVVALIDGVDFIAEAPQLWTATHLGVALLIVVVSGGAIPGAEQRQAAIAKKRNRPNSNAAIGAKLHQPDIGIADIARAFGALDLEPATDVLELRSQLGVAASAVRNGRVAVLEVHLNHESTKA